MKNWKMAGTLRLFFATAMPGKPVLNLAHKQQGAWTGLWGTQLSQRSYSGVGDEVLLPESDISNQGFFVIERLLTQNLDVEFGIRAEQQSVRPIGESEIRHNLTSYSLSTLVVLGNNSSAGVILSRAERAPTVEELLFDGEHHARKATMWETGI